MLDIAIIGAGLSGLSLAERLHQSRRNIAVFEARERCGGRILTHSPPTVDFTVDLGPTWCWPDEQPHIAALVKRLELKLFRQWDSGHNLYQIDPPTPPVLFTDSEIHRMSRRIKGGCRQLLDGLLQRLPNLMLHLQHRLLKLTDRENYFELEFAGENGRILYEAKQVVFAAPPRLLAESVIFAPEMVSRWIIMPRLREVHTRPRKALRWTQEKRTYPALNRTCSRLWR